VVRLKPKTNLTGGGYTPCRSFILVPVESAYETSY